MGLYKTTPPMSGRMGALWCLSGIRESAVIEYGCMGHMVYGRAFLNHAGSIGSRLYSTHLNETDIAMGNTRRLTRAIEQVAEQDGPRAIFLLASSTPETSGVDLEAAALEMAAQFPEIPLIPVGTGGYDHTGSQGVERTMLCLAKRLAKPMNRADAPCFNLIGACADLYCFLPDAMELSRIVHGAFHLNPLCCMTADTSVPELERLGAAQLNLVMRREGIPTAEYLERRFGTPWLCARPYGIQGTLDWVRRAEERLGLRADEDFLAREAHSASEQIAPMRAALSRFLGIHPSDAVMILCGHADVVNGIAEFGLREAGFDAAERHCDDPRKADDDMPALDDDERISLAQRRDGFLLAGSDLTETRPNGKAIQISLPDSRWHNRYEPPLIGFRGAVNLHTLLVNAMPQH